MEKSIPESEVVRLWQRQFRMGRKLADTEGKPVEVVYPGRLNDSRGGDFRDAIITSGGSDKYGCIEIHTRSSGWQAHGHHLDPAFNQVVLHVAMEPDREGKTRLQNGEAIPTVILDRQIQMKRVEDFTDGELPCRKVDRGDSGDMPASLEKAGEQRLEARSRRYQQDLSRTEAGQTLYQGVAEALGYSKNKLPFRELSWRVTLKQAEEIIQTGTTEEDCLLRLQALLLGRAGWLPSQRNLRTAEEAYPENLEKKWQEFSSPSIPFSPGWELFKVRPGNYPVRRIAALSYLLYRYREKGWLTSLLDPVRQTPVPQAHKVLVPALMVTSPGYWSSHYDFGLSHPAVSPVLLGPERAAEIIINVILPFALAWSRTTAEPALSQKVVEIYTGYPRLEPNSIERHMLHQLSLSRHTVNSACRQQGLLQIYQTLCTQGKCRECGLA